jgi:hypothetical protein
MSQNTFNAPAVRNTKNICQDHNLKIPHELKPDILLDDTPVYIPLCKKEEFVTRVLKTAVFFLLQFWAHSHDTQQI